MRTSLALAAAILALTGSTITVAPLAALDVVYVTRHAQKDASWTGDGRLRPLTPKGAACAAGLARELADAELAAVYSSETTRTVSTGAAVSGQLDEVSLAADDRTTTPSRAWVEGLTELHADDDAILVVGHSNTVDDLVLAFRPDATRCFESLRLAQPGIPETQYGDLWRIDLRAEGGCRAAISRVTVSAPGHDCTTEG